MNLINPCVANLITTCAKKLTVIWHVDNLMVSCKDDFELNLAKIHGKKLQMHLGKKHKYLGMDMEFMDKGMVQVLMITYLFKRDCRIP